MEIIRWGQGPIDFELESNDPRVLSHAGDVFRPWPASDSRRVAGRWRIFARDGMFHVVSRGRESISQTAQNLAGAVCIVEGAAIAKLLECEERVLCIHSALLSKDGRGIAIVGPALAGKTTLACALWQRGWSFHCDDAIMMIDGRAYPTPRRVSLREGSKYLVGDALWNRSTVTPSFSTTAKGCLFHPYEIEDSNVTPGATTLASIVFLARRGSPVCGPPQKLPVAETAIGLWPYTNLRTHLPFNEVLDRVAAIAEQVPGYDVPRADLGEMVDEIEDLDASLSTR